MSTCAADVTGQEVTVVDFSAVNNKRTKIMQHIKANTVKVMSSTKNILTCSQYETKVLTITLTFWVSGRDLTSLLSIFRQLKP